MGHYDDVREFNEVYNNMKDITDIVKVHHFYKNGLGQNILITKIFENALVFPIKGRVYETGEEVSYTAKGTYYTSLFDPKDLVIEEEQPMELQQDIIEAHGSQWEITHRVTTEDLVNSPNHYAFFESDTGYTEAIEIIASSMTHEEFKGYCKGNALKYRLRLGKKDKVEQDLAKANKYQELYHLHKQRTLDWGLINK